MAKPKECTRCGRLCEQTYPHQTENSIGEIVNFSLCWDCDFDVTNGGDYFEDIFEIETKREEEDYLFDPINNPKPSWM